MSQLATRSVAPALPASPAAAGAPAPATGAAAPAAGAVARAAVPGSLELDEALLDSYSKTVSWVAAELLPSVAALRLYRGRQPAGAGSGVVISSDGLLVTSAHVVEAMTRQGGAGAQGTAAFVSGEEAPLQLVSADRLSDLAVVRAAGSGYQPARLGDASRLRVGQVVVAIGNPFGFEGSVSAGVVSALGRSLLAPSGSGQRVLGEVIQTDASLHPGDSGGALANSAAEVVGINTALVGPGFGQGLGMAIPLNARAHKIIGSLAAGREVRRAFLGIGGGTRPLPRAIAATTGYSHGVEVASVVTSGPAGKAGLRPGDVVVSVGGEAVASVAALQSLLDESFIGRPAEVAFIRDGRLRRCQVSCEELRPERL
jgi:S1-C subfamily serine protease